MSPTDGRTDRQTDGQATGLDAWASRVECPARFVSHLHDICIYIYELFIAFVCFVVSLRKSVLRRCWQDEHRILTIIAQQGICGQWLGAMTHEDAGWPAPAWAPGLTQRESYLILRKTTLSRSSGGGSSCQAVDDLMVHYCNDTVCGTI